MLILISVNAIIIFPVTDSMTKRGEKLEKLVTKADNLATSVSC